MIGRLEGVIAEQFADGGVIIDVGGVGYEVRMPLGTSARVAKDGQRCKLCIHTHVREDTLTLFGFADEAERTAFRALLSVSSIGPKLALAILGQLDAQGLALAIAHSDKSAFKGISGVGAKTIERLLVDLKDKLPITKGQARPSHIKSLTKNQNLETEDSVVSALVQMGYKRVEASEAVDIAVSHCNESSVETVLRAALNHLA